MLVPSMIRVGGEPCLVRSFSSQNILVDSRKCNRLHPALSMILSSLNYLYAFSMFFFSIRSFFNTYSKELSTAFTGYKDPVNVAEIITHPLLKVM